MPCIRDRRGRAWIANADPGDDAMKPSAGASSERPPCRACGSAPRGARSSSAGTVAERTDLGDPGVVPVPVDRPLRVFVSFAPADRELKDELLKHMAVLQRIGKVEPWSVDDVRAGGSWRQEVEAALAQADTALLLLSADFLSSDFLQDVEVPKLFDRRTNEGLHVIPVVLRTCPWEFHPWIRELKPLPLTGKAIAAHQGDERDQVLTQIAVEIAKGTENAASEEPEPNAEPLLACGVPWITLTHNVSLRAQATGRNVAPISYQFSARPVSPLNSTKATLQDALEKSVQVYDTHDYGRVAHWPRPLTFGQSEVVSDGGLVWRHSYEETVNACGEEQFYAAAKPLVLAYERAAFWDNDAVAVDFGMMAFDLCLFVRVALLTISNISLLAPHGSSDVMVTASLATRRPLAAHFSHRIKSTGSRSGTFSGGFIGGEPTVVPSSAVLYTGFIANAAKAMLDGIANEFTLEPSEFSRSRTAFLSIDADSVGRLVEQLRPPGSWPGFR